MGAELTPRLVEIGVEPVAVVIGNIAQVAVPDHFWDMAESFSDRFGASAVASDAAHRVNGSRR